MSFAGVPPEIVKAAEENAEAVWAMLEKDLPDSVDLKVVKPHVISALVLTFVRAVSFIALPGIRALKQITDKKPRLPRN
jgi:hypothetical protein